MNSVITIFRRRNTVLNTVRSMKAFIVQTNAFFVMRLDTDPGEMWAQARCECRRDASTGEMRAQARCKRLSYKLSRRAANRATVEEWKNSDSGCFKQSKSGSGSVATMECDGLDLCHSIWRLFWAGVHCYWSRLYTCLNRLVYSPMACSMHFITMCLVAMLEIIHDLLASVYAEYLIC